MRTIIYISMLLLHLLISAISRGQAHAGADAQISAQADTIRPGDGHLQTGSLKVGMRQYLVYFQVPQKPDRLGFWFWVRDIRQTTLQGKEFFEVVQRWYGNDSSSYREVYSLTRRDDFAPVYHAETVRGKKAAYDWRGAAIRGADTVADNVKKGFELKFADASYNWNLDMETLEMLPLGEGKSFLISFYDAGQDPPKYVLYKVIGSEPLTLMDGRHVDCWKLFTEGLSPRGKYNETFWISKEGHEFLKEEDNFGGMYRYKIKLPGTAPDLRPRWISSR